MRRALVFFVAAAALAGRAAGADNALEDDKYRKAFEASVDRGLQYLVRCQKGDGAIGDGTPAITSLAIMAFLAHGYGPGLAPYGDVINKAVDYVLGIATPEGLMIRPGGQMYSHNISTLMLCEVSGMADPERQERIGRVLPKALKTILAAQDVSKGQRYQGGWRYEPGSTDSDISHSGWALLALRSARNNGAPVPREAIENAARFLMNCRNSDGSFSYQPNNGNGGNLSRTGIGLLCLELSGRHRDAVTMQAGEWITKRFPDFRRETTQFYALYYCASGMFQLGGEEWERFAPRLYDTVLRMQREDGSWLGGQNRDRDPAYCTSMAVLALSVSFRQLPIYQR
jgi:prenyltransferase beta subunit